MLTCVIATSGQGWNEEIQWVLFQDGKPFWLLEETLGYFWDSVQPMHRCSAIFTFFIELSWKKKGGEEEDEDEKKKKEEREREA